MRNRMFFALFIAVLLGGCMGVPVAPASAYVQSAPVYVAPMYYYSPVVPYYWGPSIYFGGGRYGAHGGGGHRGGHRGRR
ncbi:MAG: hypothetical protein NUV90_02055 [Candidatus Parcubacteria bacterium]|nr:hypothetical protein [Candidatus Parcubacteria bacterium]